MYMYDKKKTCKNIFKMFVLLFCQEFLFKNKNKYILYFKYSNSVLF